MRCKVRMYTICFVYHIMGIYGGVLGTTTTRRPSQYGLLSHLPNFVVPIFDRNLPEAASFPILFHPVWSGLV